MEFKINFKATNMELTAAVKRYAQEKVKKLQRYIPDQEDVEVIAQLELGKEVSDQNSGNVFRAELNLEVSGHLFRATAGKEDLYAAIDEMKDEAVRQLKKSKGRKGSLERRAGAKIKDELHRPDHIE